MVKIRLSRQGRVHLPSYKIVVVNAREKRETMFVDIIGSYSPITKEIIIDKDKSLDWIKKGAQPTETVKRLMIKKEILPKETNKKNYSKKPGKKKTERASA